MPDDLTPESTLDTPSAPTVELPEGFGQALQDRFGGTSKIGVGITDYEGGVGVDAVAQLAQQGDAGAPPPTPADEPPAEEPVVAPDDTSSVPAPDDDSIPAPAVEPEAASPSETLPPVSGGWDHHYIDETGAEAIQHFDDAQVRRGLELVAWADSVPQELRAALGAVESGQAIPIPRARYDAYVAWEHAQQTQTRDTDLESLDADPRVIEMLRQQRDQIAQLTQAQQSTPAPSNVDPNLTAWAMHMDNAAVEWGKARNLSDDETRTLWQAAINAGTVRILATQNARYSPTGAFVGPADPRSTAYQALDFQLSRDPNLHAAVIQRTTPAAPTTNPATAGGSTPHTPAHDDSAIMAKKARAGSLAAAPSASANTAAPRIPPHGPDLVAAIAADLTPVMNGHGQ